MLIQRYSDIILTGRPEDYDFGALLQSVRTTLNRLKFQPEQHKDWKCDCQKFIFKHIEDWEHLYGILHEKIEERPT